MSGAEIVIVTPPTAESDIELDLVNLTRFIWEKEHVGESYGYGLGGQFGYGVEYENDTFAMFPFYWGECECGWDAKSFDEPHDASCYRTELDARFEAAGLGYDRATWLPRSPGMAYDERQKRERAIYRELTGKYGLPERGCAVHCTCSHRSRFATWTERERLGPDGHAMACPSIRPNFIHKPSGLRIDWYKWIGRDTEYAPAKPSPDQWRAVFDDCVASVGSSSVQEGTDPA